MRENIYINGIYETLSGKIFVYLGRFEGIQVDFEHGSSDIKGYMYWDITERYGRDNIYKMAFHKDLMVSFNSVNNNRGKVVILKNKKAGLVRHLGYISEVMNGKLEYKNEVKLISIKRMK